MRVEDKLMRIIELFNAVHGLDVLDLEMEGVLTCVDTLGILVEAAADSDVFLLCAPGQDLVQTAARRRRD